jgi:acyl-coenzyme A thioesterase PaaI-like protein
MSDGAVVKLGSLATLWGRFSSMPGGKAFFSIVLGRAARYTGSIGARVELLEPGRGIVTMRDRPRVRNHLKSVHAIALMNLGELATGATVMYQVDGKGRGILKGIGMEYLKKSRGTITATCEVDVPQHPGKHDLEVEGVLKDSTGDTVAICKATWRIDIFETV